MKHSFPQTILCAEDDPDDRLLISEAFKESGLHHSLQFVENGEETLDYLYRRGAYSSLANMPLPGLVLLDLNMPRKDGREVLKELKSDAKLRPIPVVVLTTSTAEEDIRFSYGQGANSFIIKPERFESLVALFRMLGNYWFEIVQLPGLTLENHHGERKYPSPSRR
jgi:CheY-like chemotaxis protein